MKAVLFRILKVLEIEENDNKKLSLLFDKMI